MPKFWTLHKDMVVLRNRAIKTHPNMQYAFPVSYILKGGGSSPFANRLSEKDWWQPEMHMDFEEFAATYEPEAPGRAITMKIPSVGNKRPWVAEQLHVYQPGVEGNTRFINAPQSPPEDFRLPIGKVCCICKPYRNSEGEIATTRYLVLVTEDGQVEIDKAAADEIIRRYEEPEPQDDGDADWDGVN